MEKRPSLLVSALTLVLSLSGNPLSTLRASDSTLHLRTAVDRPLLNGDGQENKVIIKIEVEGADLPLTNRMPLNLAIVLDRSG